MPYLLKILPFSLFITGCFNELEGKLNYPHSRKDNTVTDTYFNVTVADPYRWLEDDNSDETADWVKAQNKVTFNYLNQISQRQKIRNRLEEIWDYEKMNTDKYDFEFFWDQTHASYLGAKFFTGRFKKKLYETPK